MNYRCLRIWFTVTLTLAVIAVTIRAIWQIVDIPTPGTMLIFIPLILALLGANALFAYLARYPAKMRTRAFALGMTVALTCGLIAGLTHFVRFIISPQAEPVLSKVISAFVLSSSLSAYFLALYIIWSLSKVRDGKGKV